MLIFLVVFSMFSFNDLSCQSLSDIWCSTRESWLTIPRSDAHEFMWHAIPLSNRHMMSPSLIPGSRGEAIDLGWAFLWLGMADIKPERTYSDRFLFNDIDRYIGWYLARWGFIR
jgi:hypothetical protein